MFKRLISCAAALAMAFGAAAYLPDRFLKQNEITANAEGVFTYGDYEYELFDDGTVEISKYYGNETDLIIPSVIEGRSVVSIGNYSFSGCNSIKSIIMPDSILSLSFSAFSGCNNLTTVKLSNNLKSIPTNAFSNCENIKSITIPDSVEQISGAAFGYCTSLETVIFGKGLKTIGYQSFIYCTSLKSLEIPNSVEIIDDGAFCDCSNLEIVLLSNNLKSIGFSAFSNCEKIESIVIPDSITVLESSTFRWCTGLKEVTLSKNLLEIKDSAFEYCKNLEHIELPNGLKSLTGNFHFSGCDNLESIIIPESVSNIGENSLPSYSTIYGVKNSYAENFVNSHGIIYKFDYIKHDHVYESTVTKTETCKEEGVITYTCKYCDKTYTEAIPKSYTHTFSNWINDKEATCVSKGTRLRKCSICGEIETQIIPESDHSYITKEIKPTYDSEGYTQHTCSVCGDSYKDNYTDKLVKSHTHAYTSKVTIAATCTNDGVKTYTCSCGDSYTETIPKLTTHTFGNWTTTKAATCAAEGTQTRTCSVCGKAETKSIAKITTHSYTSKVIAPTTTAQGYTLHTCSVCGASYQDNYTDKVHTHNYTSQVTRTATCAATGVRTYTCACGDTYTETIPKTAHNYTAKVIAPTTSAQGYTLHTCSVCGASYKDNYTDKVHTHNYTSQVTRTATCAATGVRTYTCSCGDSYTETIPKLTTHTFGNWSVTTAATCKTEGTETRKCSVCGKTETKSIAKTAHNYTTKVIAPTTTAQGYTEHTCSVCGDSYRDTFTDKLAPQSISKATVTGISAKTYTGKAITQNPTVKLGSKTLKKGTDYTVTFKNNKAVGKATVTIKGKGNYTGSVSKTFKINPKKTTLKTATSPKTKKLKVTYSKVSGVTGYQITYATSSDFKTGKKNVNATGTSKTISGLTKGKTYYVKVRTYKTVNGTKYYSGYSAVKKIKIK